MTELSVLRSTQELESVAHEWDGLAAMNGSPFVTVAWLSSWCKVYGSRGLAVVVLRDDQGRLIAGASCRRLSRSTWEGTANVQSGNWDVVAIDEAARRLIWGVLANLGPSRIRLDGLIAD